MSAGALRRSLERKPKPDGRDPFKVDEDKALEALRLQWRGLYVIRVRGGKYEATRKQRPHETFEAGTPDELNRLVLGDWASW